MKKIVGIAGWSGSGKTTLVESLIKIFKYEYKLNVCILKHAHKNFRIDKEGKDSYKFSEAGADQVIISSENQWATINKIKGEEKSLEFLLKQSLNADVTLVEGWKFSNIKKIEIYRQEINKGFLYIEDSNIVAIALQNISISLKKNIHKLDLNNHLDMRLKSHYT